MLRPTLLALAAGLLAACAGDDGTSVPGPAPTHEQLARGTVFLLDAQRSEATLHAAVYVGVTPALDLDVGLPVSGGVVWAGVDDRDDVELDDLALSLGAARMPMGGDLGHGMLVSDFMLRTRDPVAFPDTLWSDDDEIGMATGAAALLSLEWTVTVDVKDEPWPERVEVRRTTAIDLDLMVLPARDRLELVVYGQTRPFVWSWGPFVVSSDLDLTLDGFVEREP